MSQSLMAATTPYGRDGLTNGEITVSGEEHITTVLNALNDGDCRTILEELRNTEEYLSASELSDRCGVPLSTTYRKVELLTDAALVEEQLRIRRSGKHTSEYGHSIDDVKISVTPDAGVELELSHCLSA
ncbi:helix-turn-helix domain-containing protein [Natrialbaceae archaeon A-CW3]